MAIFLKNGRIGVQNRKFSLKQGALGAAFGLAAFSLVACAGETPLPSAKFTAENCSRVSFTADGSAVVGAEDLDINRAEKKLLISAYDRRAAEKAAKHGADKVPEGGIYRVSIDTIVAQPKEPIAVSSIVDSDEIVDGLRPHGITFNPITNEIGFINRAYVRNGEKWRMTPRIERIGAGGAAFMGAADRTPCAANDLVTGQGKTFVSFDHGFCDWRASLENIFSLRRSGVAVDGIAAYRKGLFANGVARLSPTTVALAETRDKALVVLNQSGDDLKVGARYKIPGGPDNLTISDDGSVIAAVHPNLMKMGAHRKLGWRNFGWDKAPSRIVKINPETGDFEILFDDPKGALFSAATVGLEWKNALVIGSATDSGLLVCKKS